MNPSPKLGLFFASLVVILSVAAAGKVARTHWLNEDMAVEADYDLKKHVREYGTNTFYGKHFSTNFHAQIGSGTNRHDIEFGFRDDGVVVWRRVK